MECGQECANLGRQLLGLDDRGGGIGERHAG